MNKLPFNACDYRCEHCLATDECAVFQKLQERLLQHALDGGDEHELAAVLHDVRESFRETETRIREKAREIGIDIDAISDRTSREEILNQERNLLNDPLYRQSHDFTLETSRFLQAAKKVVDAAAQEYIDDIAWHHTVVTAKICRTLGWRADGENAADAADSAAVAVKSLTILIMAFDYLAAHYPNIAWECRKLYEDARKIKEGIRERFKPARAA